MEEDESESRPTDAAAVDPGQGDQIGRIFAHWVNVFTLGIFLNYKSSHPLWVTF
jgi:hypothetical protein